jgi:L-alanine-DL-glutamate epimerase-like enolase superfamily enzyme
MGGVPLKISDIMVYIHDSNGALVRITTDEGIDGYGSVGNGSAGRPPESEVNQFELRYKGVMIRDLVKPDLVGRNVTDREWFWSQRYRYRWWGKVDTAAISAIDVALWDIAGKAAGLPVYKVIGSQRDKVPAYASAPYFDDLKEHASFALECKGKGYRALKLKPSGGPRQRMLSVPEVKKIALEVREAVGDDMELMLDGQLVFNYEEALELGYHLEKLNYKWFEDPVRHIDCEAIRGLCRKLNIPIALSDHWDFGYDEAVQAIRQYEGLKILRGDVWKEGITGLKKLCSIADGFNMNCEAHVGALENLHVILSVNNCDYYEDVYLNAIDEEGFVTAPATPGIGYDSDYINSFIKNAKQVF